jgi:hypothetical protein
VKKKNRVNYYPADQLAGTKKKNPTSHFRIRGEKKCWKMIPWSLTQFGDTCMRHAANTPNLRNASSSPLRYARATTASCKLHMQGTRNEKANSPQACIGFPRILKRNFFFPLEACYSWFFSRVSMMSDDEHMRESPKVKYIHSLSRSLIESLRATGKMNRLACISGVFSLPLG